ncbi:hypothetical protein EC968_002832 [Mortierella alpina]|nr:hypothetical protein EC968_002832 [Mortierella alpina]
MASSTGHHNQPTQPSPDSQPSPRLQADEEIPVSEQDLETLRVLEEALEAVKQSVAHLLRESRQEETALEETHSAFNKERDVWTKQVEQDELEIETLKEQLEMVEDENAELGDELIELQVECDKYTEEILHLEETFEADNEETERMLLEPPVEVKKAEAKRLQKLIDKQEVVLRETMALWDKVQDTDVIAYYGLAYELRVRKDRLQELESELALEDMDMDLEATLGMSIEEEFEVLKIRHSVPKGSDFDKKMIALQAELKARYDREYASEKKSHSAALDRINVRTLSHFSRLNEFKRAIKNANSNIEQSKNTLEQAEQEVLQIRSEKETRLREIAEAAKLLAALS